MDPRKASSSKVFGVGTALCLTAAKKGGKRYRGVVKAAESFTTRWCRDEGESSWVQHAAEDAKSDDKGRGGGQPYCYSNAAVKGTQGLIRPPVPGFQVTQMFRCFIGTETKPPFLTRCVCAFGWFVPCRWRTVNKSVSFTELEILFRLAACRFSTEACTSILRCRTAAVVAIGRNLGYTK